MKCKNIVCFLLWLAAAVHSFAVWAINIDSIQINGKITKLSKYPDARQADYPHCNYTAVFEYTDVRGGKHQILLVMPAFKDRLPAKAGKLQTGDIVCAEIKGYDLLPEETKAIYLADDINAFDLPWYYLNSFEYISRAPAANRVTIDAKKRQISRTPLNPPLSEVSAAGRKKDIAKDLTLINQRLGTVKTQNWRTVFAAAKNKLPYAEATYKNKKYFTATLDGRFFMLAKDYNFAEAPSMNSVMPAILSLNKYLKRHHVDLICIPVPLYNHVAARAMVPELKDYESKDYLTSLKTLLENDVEVIDLIPDLLSGKYSKKELFYYHIDNWHPHLGLVETMGAVVKERLQRYALPVQDFKKSYGMEKENYYLYSKDALGPEEKNQNILLSLNGKNWEPKESGAPVQIWANSFGSTPDSNAWAKEIAFQGRTFTSAITRSGANIMRQFPLELLNNEKLLSGVKAVVLCLPWPYMFLKDIEKLRDELILKEEAANRCAIVLNSVVFQQPADLKENRKPGVIYCTQKNYGEISIPLPAGLKEKIQKERLTWGLEIKHDLLDAKIPFSGLISQMETKKTEDFMEPKNGSFFIFTPDEAMDVITLRFSAQWRCGGRIIREITLFY